jgi:hypothetical protein
VQTLQVHRTVGEAERPPGDNVPGQQVDAGLDAVGRAGCSVKVVAGLASVVGQIFARRVNVRGLALDPRPLAGHQRSQRRD